MAVDSEMGEELLEIIGSLSCPKDFRCYRLGFENLCKAQDIGLESYLECLEEDAGGCAFAFSFGFGYFCKCPVRVYLGKHLKK